MALSRFNSLIQKERKILFWILQFAGWLASFFVLLLASRITDTAVGWLICFRTIFGFLVTSIFGRPLLRFLRNKYASRFVELGLVAAFLAIGLGSMDAYFTDKFGRLMQIDMQASSVILYLKIGYIIRPAIFGVWILLYFVINYWLDSRTELFRTAQLVLDKQTSDLNLLRAQVNPHFLFNALNSILAVSDDSLKVTAITQSLADFLRFSLRSGDGKQPLGEELDALESYLQVEKIRFSDRLEYAIEADEAARGKIVPGALVQPLLENAIKFGQRTSPRPLRISIQARLSEGTLDLIVENTGHWVSKKDSTSTRIGLRSLGQRLRLICGPEAKLTVKHPPGRVILEVHLPEQYIVNSRP